MKTTLKIMLVALMMTLATTASAINYNQARRQALFLADKMAYELNLTERQYNAVYRINLNYLLSVNNRRDVFGNYWTRRNYEMRRLLARWQYNRYVAANYFYRPVYWSNNGWNWRIYSRYPANNGYHSSYSYSRSSCSSGSCSYDYDDDCDYGRCNSRRYNSRYNNRCYDYDDDDCDDCDYSNYNTNVNTNVNNNVNVNNIINSNGRPGFRFW